MVYRTSKVGRAGGSATEDLPQRGCGREGRRRRGQETGKTKSENYSQGIGVSITFAFSKKERTFVLSNSRHVTVKLEFGALFTKARVHLKSCSLCQKVKKKLEATV